MARADPSTNPLKEMAGAVDWRVTAARWFLLLNAAALVLVALWFRVRSLGNIPGVNGDEAWYGVVAWQMTHGGPVNWHTPTGNPLNPLFVGPLALLHIWLPPSIVLLRCMALAGGLAALVVNWWFCRWVFDRRTATVSTVVLAILPINIAYSRFAWDASQSLAVTLPVLYLSLAAVRFPHRFGPWIAAATLALALAFWVHPTNVFAGAPILVAWAVWRRRKNAEHTVEDNDHKPSGWRVRAWCLALFATAGLLATAWVGTARWAHGPLPGRLSRQLASLHELVIPGDRVPAAVLYPRLFTGGTVYRYLAGSRSWFEWPLPAEFDGWGLDVGVFWVCLIGVVWVLWRSGRLGRDHQSRADSVLLGGWALQIAAFLLAGGLDAMQPGEERFAICLIGPGVLLLSRGATLAWEAASTRWRVVLAVATLAGWPMLADFHTHYFRFIERTGGQSHLTFRTAAVEPKQAALQSILEDARKTGTTGPRRDEVWIVCSEWWNRWPIHYLASERPGVRVVDPEQIGEPNDYRRALAERRVWFVEFRGTEAERRVEARLADQRVTRRQFSDYGGRPLLSVLHVDGP